MTLRSGSRLGPYEIVALLGSGGMGEVYRARDPRLRREVAVKVLHASIGADPERLQRFETEARATAAINHPNIVAVFDVGRENGQPYVVSELLDGETLRDLLRHGALPPRKTVDVGVQIARGLSAAHDKHIIHRDLKPENVFITRDGRAKILDFGLAKLTAAAEAALATRLDASGLQTSPPATNAGVVLGTVGYMAPEQVRGTAADHRTDVFALGVVLFEMLTGERAFSGPSPVETMNAILKQDLRDLAMTHAGLSPALDRIVRRCVEKSPDERFQSARDLAFALEALSGSHPSAPASAEAVPRRRTVRRAVAAALVVAAILLAGVAGRLTAPAQRAADLVFESKTFEPQVIFNARFMPDGETVVFSSAIERNRPELFVSRPGVAAPQPLGHRDTHLLSVSSTGELAVLTDASFIAHRLFRGTLARMPIAGAPRAWMENVRDADWSPDGSTLALVRDTGLQDRLEYPIGKLLHESNGYLSDVRVSPDGERVAFFEHHARYDDRGWLKVADRAGKVTTLTQEFWGAEGIAWTPDGRGIVYAAGKSGWDSFHPRGVTLDGEAIADLTLPGIGLFLMDVSRRGHRLVTRNDEVRSLRARLPGDASEREFPWLGTIGAAGNMLSGDGKLLMFSDESQAAGPTYSVSVRRVDTGSVISLGTGDAMAISPDGRLVLADALAPARHVVIYPVGAGETVHLPLGPLEYVTGRAWFPDGRRVVVCGNERGRAVRCYEQDIVGGLPKPIAPEQYVADAVSPDGTTLALTRSDRMKYVFRIGGDAPRLIPGTTTRDVVIGWSEDGRSVFVQERPATSARLERVDVATGRRSLVVDMALPDATGLLRVAINSVSRDGGSYTYTYWKRLTSLFVVKEPPEP